MKIYVIDEEVGFPGKQEPNSQGHDLAARKTVTIKAGHYNIVPLNVIVDYGVDDGTQDVLLVFPRSSLGIKKGLMLYNSIGFIDKSYKGPEDEIKAILFNTTDKDVVVERGERVAQLAVVKLSCNNEIESVGSSKEIKAKSRGGLGSTGGYKE